MMYNDDVFENSLIGESFEENQVIDILLDTSSSVSDNKSI